MKQESELIETRPQEAITASSEGLKGYLKEVAIKYGQNYTQMAATVQCESSFKTDVFSRGKISFGIAQFRLSTWEWLNKIRKTNMDYENPFDQLDMMGWAWSKGYQKHWDCYRMLFLGEKL